ncbi:type II toxin-antitoxin system RelE/ParE family toxin [Fluoribacter gormanii]|uniref:Toxin ParE1 n=1 Tax=Fluoribacter gormanii TaxID=464 RepID=A0A377GKK5_9GAMM|nr:type II toxin-antitoxin system RelE/ParE family toxin [Fluoribacter gormanii]KTD05387.1 putative toxin antitoxin plasmid stabilization system ParE [Fluoribacter gormanii]SIR62264.1 toxin ParE1/3/4 [Fluoribacter gormanii]STO25311.1 Toxin ParE1 [Fluoribacter gormanii]
MFEENCHKITINWSLNYLEPLIFKKREFGFKGTEDYILAIDLSFQRLADDPFIARKCDYIRPKLRASNVGSHIIFFKTIDYGIAIIRVLHQPMDFNRHL